MASTELVQALLKDPKLPYVRQAVERELERRSMDWRRFARPDQLLPAGEWNYWLILSGRGWGKTRTGAEAVRQWVKTNKYVNLIGATADDARDIMIEGEAVALDTPIPTPNGWTTMGELTVGQTVFAGDGQPTKVEWVSEVASDRPCYRVTFRNGESVVADARHQWLVHDCRNYGGSKILTTEQMLGRLRHAPKQYRFTVQMHDGLNLPHRELLIDPYTLGVWLGDGHSHHAAFTTMDEEVLEGVVGETRAWSQKSSKATTYGIRGGLYRQLSELDLLANKHIPRQYFRASKEQRLLLLAGLMDTDGCCSTNGQCEFSNTNWLLIAGVQELLSSLGILHSTCAGGGQPPGGLALGSTKKPYWRVRFKTNLLVFRVTRKLERSRLKYAKRVPIVSIEPVESVPTRCIAVDHPQHIYLFGHSMLPTHNSGIMAICPKVERPIYRKYARKLVWPNGATSLVFTADEPERLRGKQHMKLWADELASWRYSEAWDQAMFGLRLGAHPQAVITTTPRPTKQLRELAANPATYVTKGTTYDNRANLAPSFFTQIIKRYENTRLGRQELNAEILEDNPNALWKRADIDKARITKEACPPLQRIVIGLDPSVSDSADHDMAGIIAVGKGAGQWRDHGYVIDDKSILASPLGWARQTIGCYGAHKADRVVGEINNGGAMIEVTLRTIDPNVSYQTVTASRGKLTRAEPYAALYEQGRIHHVGLFPELEDELCDYDQLGDKPSPNRLDALVWGLHALFGEGMQGQAIFDYLQDAFEKEQAAKNAVLQSQFKVT